MPTYPSMSSFPAHGRPSLQLKFQPMYWWWPFALDVLSLVTLHFGLKTCVWWPRPQFSSNSAHLWLSFPSIFALCSFVTASTTTFRAVACTESGMASRPYDTSSNTLLAFLIPKRFNLQHHVRIVLKSTDRLDRLSTLLDSGIWLNFQSSSSTMGLKRPLSTVRRATSFTVSPCTSRTRMNALWNPIKLRPATSYGMARMGSNSLPEKRSLTV